MDAPARITYARDREHLVAAYKERVIGIARRWGDVVTRRADALDQYAATRLMSAGVSAGTARVCDIDGMAWDIRAIRDDRWPA